MLLAKFGVYGYLVPDVWDQPSDLPYLYLCRPAITGLLAVSLVPGCNYPDASGTCMTPSLSTCSHKLTAGSRAVCLSQASRAPSPRQRIAITTNSCFPPVSHVDYTQTSTVQQRTSNTAPARSHDPISRAYIPSQNIKRINPRKMSYQHLPDSPPTTPPEAAA
jgi:hypothetical protein